MSQQNGFSGVCRRSSSIGMTMAKFSPYGIIWGIVPLPFLTLMLSCAKVAPRTERTAQGIGCSHHLGSDGWLRQSLFLSPFMLTDSRGYRCVKYDRAVFI